MHIFLRAVAPNGILQCQVQNPFCVQVFRYPVLAALLHSTGAVGVKLCGVVSSGDRAAIPFDIGRSSCLVILVLRLELLISETKQRWSAEFEYFCRMAPLHNASLIMGDDPTQFFGTKNSQNFIQ